ncbi:flagellar hook assembly protein FlgD [Oceanicola granulosus HTCC2516]|uniref:Basal-body rod modification protein FlgD n=1 Tax=Oceanicola granulosus (strain ATCC BAA-861 / DSM 15982 / KCTC 12143 / HTCC2516) TaxID=314256 RepID=Q2CGF8_OCEGH|nr:flagellar hook capping FlgD N-terminal domain-containing protein [Oceanicola granulosus]EAR51760.1 flagellar hook assembly protein FlgD [Oceanicola granulosus HTCC2516]
MALTGITPAASATQTATTGSNAAMDSNYQNFLKMLTAQVTNQDPLAPMDSSTFVTQLAQLSQVEQTVQSNGHLRELLAGVQSFGSMAEVQLIGKPVTYASDRISLAGGSADYLYSLDAEAASAKLVITGADGQVLREIGGLAVTPGERHAVTWDGRDSQGLPVPDGTFTAEIRAVDADGEQIGYSGYASSVARALEFGPDGSMLTMENGEEVLAVTLAGVGG